MDEIQKSNMLGMGDVLHCTGVEKTKMEMQEATGISQKTAKCDSHIFNFLEGVMFRYPQQNTKSSSNGANNLTIDYRI